MRKLRNLTLSATAPDTIVAAVPANTSWKKNLAPKGTPVQLRELKIPLYASPIAGLLSAPCKNKPPRPMKGLPSLNIRPNPMTQKATVERANRHLRKRMKL